MLTSLILSGVLLGMALWREGFGFLVWIDLLISASNFAILLLHIFP